MRPTKLAFIFIGMVLWLSSCGPIKPVPLTPFADGTYWVVEKPLVYQVGDTDREIVVPEGFVTDFASIPRPLWSSLPKTGRYQLAAVVHDYLYWEQSTTREEADKILLKAMKESEVGAVTRITIYDGVRAGGWAIWKQNAKEKSEGLPRIIPPEYRDIPANTNWSEYRKMLYDAGVRP
jgi:hypothetical protein